MPSEAPDLMNGREVPLEQAYLLILTISVAGVMIWRARRLPRWKFLASAAAGIAVGAGFFSVMFLVEPRGDAQSAVAIGLWFAAAVLAGASVATRGRR